VIQWQQIPAEAIFVVLPIVVGIIQLQFCDPSGTKKSERLSKKKPNGFFISLILCFFEKEGDFACDVMSSMTNAKVQML